MPFIMPLPCITPPWPPGIMPPPCGVPPCIICCIIGIICCIMGAIFSIMGIICCIVDIIVVHCSGDPPGIAFAAGIAILACGASVAG
ncbi:MAG: hypothetical protein E5W69_05700 [Mesorhizobium sp.]|nr:MAG: hypothetical protein E5W69_05700 [Mesorhizobium sp.]